MDFESYVAQARRPLLRFAVVLTDDPDLAQDIVHDVLLRAQHRWFMIGGLDQPHAYVRRMLVNHVVSWRRKWGRVEPRPDHVLDHAIPDPSDAVARRDAILRRLASLPARQRAAVVMRYYEDMTEAEIAAALGCQPVTARGLIHRALKSMRVDLAASAAVESFD